MSVIVQTFASVTEAANAVSSDAKTRYLGGGSIVMRQVNHSDQNLRTVVRTTDSSLTKMDISGDRISIGAGVTMTAILANRQLDFLHKVAQIIGSPAVRNVATVGGNLFANHPYGDFATALLALEATVSLATGQSIALEALLQNRQSGQHPVVVSVTFNRPQPGTFRFRKVARSKPKGAAMMTIAVHLPRAGGIIKNARVAYGAMAATPIRVPAVEQALNGQRLDGPGITAALAVATRDFTPPTDALASEWYRREVAPVHLKRTLLEP
jgi:CO/xanthine dehydrogenase FAD-binding subunit